ncbi:MAG TPA: hypothetical protein VIN08_08680 [Ohtaekwangia sp.]|uniref:hypothetical protein n=1 Tax=Ohtaekwangia sp. TaxID=2066019 RepID=UPI002F929B9C
MLTLKKTEDRYFISHSSGKISAAITYQFHKDSLPVKTQQHLCSLYVPDETKYTYTLSDKQEQELVSILRKIKKEKKSDYIFTDHLQKTYLVELVHFITKVHYKRLEHL